MFLWHEITDAARKSIHLNVTIEFSKASKWSEKWISKMITSKKKFFEYANIIFFA